MPISNEDDRNILDLPKNISMDPKYTVEDHPTMRDSDYLDDLMSLLTAYHFRKPLPDSHPSVAVISTLSSTIQDGVFTSMQNYGDKLSSDSTVWDLTRHEIDGSRVLKSRSFSPNISRFKVKTHVRMDIDTVWEHVSNWHTRPLYDQELYRANILREVEVRIDRRCNVKSVKSNATISDSLRSPPTNATLSANAD